ncbi:MAG: hypothetical protein ROW39_00275 [Anaerolineaceae bacterium]|jgi:hypothetical protein
MRKPINSLSRRVQLSVFDFLGRFIDEFLPPHPTLHVVRRDDLLVLTFQFIDLQLVKTVENGEPAAYLVPGKSPYIVAYFQGQNIAEEAFFEADSDLPAKGGAANDPDEGKTSSTPIAIGTRARARLARRSRLVFKVPPGEPPIPYTLESLLERLSHYPLSVAPTARPPEPKLRLWLPPHFWTTIQQANWTNTFDAIFSAMASQPSPTLRHSAGLAVEPAGLATGRRTAEPSAPQSLANVILEQSHTQLRKASSALQPLEYAVVNDNIAEIFAELMRKPFLRAPYFNETAIEAPWRLLLSPNKYGAWVHAVAPVISPAGRVELWHTRLATRHEDGAVTEEDDFLRTVRAIWTLDPGFDKHNPANVPPRDNLPFRMSLDRADRHNIVHLSANYRITYQDNPKKKPKEYRPEPVNVRGLMLSSLGAWLDLRGAWDVKAEMGLSVEEWRHRGTMGRDHYVRVVYKGYLLPFGHRASLIKVTERKFHPTHPGNVAYLRQRMFIVVRQPERLFNASGVRTAQQESYDRMMPLRRVRITTLVTPNLMPPEDSQVENYGQNMFWPRLGSGDFMFHLIGEDSEGRRIEFDAPLLFVSSEKSQDVTAMGHGLNSIKTSAPKRNVYALKGQRMAFAKSHKPGDTDFETESLTFGGHVPDQSQFDALRFALNDFDIPRFYPRLDQSAVSIPAIRHLAGQGQSAQFTFQKDYLVHGFDAIANNGQVFASLAPLNLSFSGQGDRAGGLVQPNLQITGLSRSMGPVAGDLSKLVSGDFNAQDFFQALDAKIFGVISLWDIIAAIGGKISDHLGEAPKLLTESLTAAASFAIDLERLQQRVMAAAAHLGSLANDLDTDISNILVTVQGLLDGTSTPTDLLNQANSLAGHLQSLASAVPGLPPSVPADVRQDLAMLAQRFGNDLANANQFVDRFVAAIRLAEEIKVSYEWKPELKDWNNIFIANNKGKKASLALRAELQAVSKFRIEPSFSISCVMENFSIDLLGNLQSFIVIRFEKIAFVTTSQKKPDVDVKLGEIEFVGVLSFVQALRELIPLDGFSDPPSVNITTEGISAGFSLALPNIAFGVFSLQNLSLGAGFSVPFVDKPLSVRFNFCERHAPFLLTVSLFGGGGFFAITVDPRDVQILEAAFEFGASVSVNFGVASGGVEVMAGIYYAIKEGNASLTGYFRMGGHLSVLGIISVSIELYLELRYEFSTGKCVGKAVLTIEVEVFLFSISVSITCERKFAGSNGDPTFRQLMEPYQDADSGLLVTPWDQYCGAFA